MSDADTTPAVAVPHKESLLLRAFLWGLAFFLAASAMIYQRKTGPTYPMRGDLTVNNNTVSYKLIRTHETTAGAKVSLPRLGEDVTATLNYRRYPTKEAFTPLTMTADEIEGEKVLAAELPVQPAAGKIEYEVTVNHNDGTTRLPEDKSEYVILRYKEPVPETILLPHVLMMILAILIGMRAGLAALLAPSGMRRYAWLALGFMTCGGMVLGPIVQKYAFGEYWTGFPFGGDWTDNKMLVMWVAWLFACGTIGFKAKNKEIIGRCTVILASIVMTIVYLIPHSMGGSQVDWEEIDKGVDPKEAIKTGKQ